MFCSGTRGGYHAAWPPDYPRGARFTYPRKNAAHLNGLEVRILSWEAEREGASRRQGRLQGQARRAGWSSGAPGQSRALRRPVHEARRRRDLWMPQQAAELAGRRSAARAAATCHTWRRLLKDGAWPKTGHAHAPRHWRDELVGGQLQIRGGTLQMDMGAPWPAADGEPWVPPVARSDGGAVAGRRRHALAWRHEAPRVGAGAGRGDGLEADDV